MRTTSHVSPSRLTTPHLMPHNLTFTHLDISTSTVDQFLEGLEEMGLEGLTQAQMVALHEDCDTDGDGELTLTVFTESVAHHYQESMKREALSEALSHKRKGEELSTAELIALLHDDEDE